MLKNAKWLEYLTLGFFVSSTVLLVALQNDELGLLAFISGLTLLLFCSTNFIKHISLLYLCLGILAVMPIETTLDQPTAGLMGLGLLSVVVLPFFVTRKLYKNDYIKFPILKEKAWGKTRILYLLFTAFACYLVIPYMLRDTGSYVNWEVEPGFWNMLESYIGLNLVGIWDEVFFVCTVFALLQRFFPFWIANIAQATIFTSFLYTLAFVGWSPLVIFPFALLQGYIFKKTKSLLFILAIHLTVDLILHLTIVHLNRPDLFQFFIT